MPDFFGPIKRMGTNNTLRKLTCRATPSAIDPPPSAPPESKNEKEKAKAKPEPQPTQASQAAVQPEPKPEPSPEPLDQTQSKPRPQLESRRQSEGKSKTSDSRRASESKSQSSTRRQSENKSQQAPSAPASHPPTPDPIPEEPVFEPVPETVADIPEEPASEEPAAETAEPSQDKPKEGSGNEDNESDTAVKEVEPPTAVPGPDPEPTASEQMASETEKQDANANLHAVVDMGSNGVRFSITDLDPRTARVLPTIFQDRCGVSLFDAQWSTGARGPIPEEVIDTVVRELLRFKKTCRAFGVPDENTRIIATEATRTAINSEEYRTTLETVTNWKVEMLPKEEEGRIGAMGVASSFSTVRGLVMDLGGGSTQLTWLIMENGNIRLNPRGSVSLPYGAAALTQRMRDTQKKGDHALDELGNEITQNLTKAVSELQIPEELLETAKAEGGLRLYLSGGGFRGWGYLLMSIHEIQPYPIPIINGFSIPCSAFRPEDILAKANFQSNDAKIFRVSKRRASQVPAVSFLIDSLLAALPDISHIYFAQGGVREGVHFSKFPPHVQGLHPLNAATSPYAPTSTSTLVKWLRQCIPSQHFSDPEEPLAPHVPEFLAHDDILLTSLAHLLNFHAPLPKDSRAVTGLRSTTSGVIAGVHGLAHESRALLALALSKRWGGEIAPIDESFYWGLVKLVGPYEAWWAEYLGVAAAAIGDTFPGGIIPDGTQYFQWLTASWHVRDVCKHGRDKIEILVDVRLEGHVENLAWIKELERLGKKKHWIDGEGVRTRVSVARGP